MNRHIRLLLSLAALLMLLLVAISKPAGADGIAIDSFSSYQDLEMPAQKAILVYDEQNQREDLILSIELRGGPEAAWVVPVPSLPEIEVASLEWFEELSDMTKPIVEYHTETVYVKAGEPIIVEKEVGVEVISREEVGVYDVSILSADKPGALMDWLNENGYAYPEEGEPLLDTYMEEGGWYFVAARVLPEKSDRLDGDVHPLWFSFDTERPIYPMRLTTLVKKRLHVLIYVLADHRMEIPGHGFETEFAGELTLKPVVAKNAESVKLLTQQSYYVTKLRNESLFAPDLTEDLYFEQSASDEPYRKVLYEYRTVYITETAEPSSQVSETAEPSSQVSEWMMLGLGLALLGVLAALGLVWRRRSRPKPGKEP